MLFVTLLSGCHDQKGQEGKDDNDNQSLQKYREDDDKGGDGKDDEDSDDNSVDTNSNRADSEEDNTRGQQPRKAPKGRSPRDPSNNGEDFMPFEVPGVKTPWTAGQTHQAAAAEAAQRQAAPRANPGASQLEQQSKPRVPAPPAATTVDRDMQLPEHKSTLDAAADKDEQAGRGGRGSKKGAPANKSQNKRPSTAPGGDRTLGPNGTPNGDALQGGQRRSFRRQLSDFGQKVGNFFTGNHNGTPPNPDGMALERWKQKGINIKPDRALWPEGVHSLRPRPLCTAPLPVFGLRVYRQGDACAKPMFFRSIC